MCTTLGKVIVWPNKKLKAFYERCILLRNLLRVFLIKTLLTDDSLWPKKGNNYNIKIYSTRFFQKHYVDFNEYSCACVFFKSCMVNSRGYIWIMIWLKAACGLLSCSFGFVKSCMWICQKMYVDLSEIVWGIINI